MRIAYYATQSIITGHVVDTEYVMGIGAADIARTRTIKKTVRRAIAGNRRDLLHYRKYKWAITTVSIDPADLDQWDEFLESVSLGEIFVFDPDGDASTEVNPVNVKLVNSSYKRKLHVKETGDTTDQRYRYSFSVEEA